MATIKSEFEFVEEARSQLSDALIRRFGVREDDIMNDDGSVRSEGLWTVKSDGEGGWIKDELKRIHDWAALVIATNVHTDGKLIFRDDGSGADVGTEFNGYADTAISYNSIGAMPVSVAIDGVSYIGTNISHYGECNTAATEQVKEVTISGYKLLTGSKVYVKFTLNNTATDLQLNVSGTGAIPIYYRGAAIPARYLTQNKLYCFVFDGTNYELVGDVLDAVNLQPADAEPQKVGIPSVGSSYKYALEDHVHGIDVRLEESENAVLNLTAETNYTLTIANRTISFKTPIDTKYNYATGVTLPNDVIDNDKVPTSGIIRGVYGEKGIGWNKSRIYDGYVYYYNTNTWQANTSEQEGYVKSPNKAAYKVWSTKEAESNPDWISWDDLVVGRAKLLDWTGKNENQTFSPSTWNNGAGGSVVWGQQWYDTELAPDDPGKMAYFLTNNANATKAYLNTVIDGYSYAKGFRTLDKNNDYVLLAGGGTKELTDFLLAGSFVKTTGDTMTGDLVMNTKIRFKSAAGDTVTKYITSTGTNDIRFSVDDKQPLILSDTAVRPSNAEGTVISLGTASQPWKGTYTTILNITSTTGGGHLNFNRAAANYITAPEGGSFAFVPNGNATGIAGATIRITDRHLLPGSDTSNRTKIGLEDNPFGNAYLTDVYADYIYGSSIYARFSADTSQVRYHGFKNTSGDTIAVLGYHNTAQKLYLNPIYNEISNVYEDALGKYSLAIGKNHLTYNTYPILHSGNFSSYVTQEYVNNLNITAIDLKAYVMGAGSLLGKHMFPRVAFYYANGGVGLTDIPTWTDQANGFGMMTMPSAGAYYMQLLSSSNNTLSWRRKQLSDQTEGGWKLLLDSETFKTYVTKAYIDGLNVNADTLDGVHASGLFTNLSNDSNQLSITIGGTNKKLEVAYAKSADTANFTHNKRIYANLRHTKSDNKGWPVYVCIADVTEIWNASSGATHKGFVGIVMHERHSGYSIGNTAFLNCKIGYNKDNYSLNCTASEIVPCVIQNGSKYYLALTLKGSGHDYYFYGYALDLLNPWIEVLTTDSTGTLPSGYSVVKTGGPTSLWANVTKATSADKLTTARKLWGLTFDGTADVKGDIKEVAHIYASGNQYLSSTSPYIFFRSGLVGPYIVGGETTFDISWHKTDNSFNKNIAKFTSDGKVGIGMTPEYTLDVNGSTRTTTLKIGSTTAQKHIEYSRTDYNYIITPSTEGTMLAFASPDIGSANTKVLFNMNTGDVGIGIVTPLSRLHVNGGLITQTVQTTWLTSARLQIGRRDATKYSDRACIGLTDGDLHIDAYTGKSVYINYYKSGAGGIGQAVVINSEGKVGLGVTPTERLCINGWVATHGNTGWYNCTYKGGWYMNDETYVRSYNNKCVYLGGGARMPNSPGISQEQDDTSNYAVTIKWLKNGTGWYKDNTTLYTRQPQIGLHNTGDTYGSIVLLPYATDTNPWDSAVGLYISKTRLKYENNTVIHSGNITNYYWANVHISASSNSATTPTFASMTATSSAAIASIKIHNTDEINRFSGNLYLQHRGNETTATGNIIALKNGGLMGIGTSSPVTKLHIEGGNLRVSSSNSGAGGDVYTELWRGTNASWKILNNGGTLKFQSNYTTAVTTYFDAMTLAYNTGNLWLKGQLVISTNTYPLLAIENTTTATERSIYLRNNTAGWAITLAGWSQGAGLFVIGQYNGTGSSNWRFKINNNGYCFTQNYLNVGAGNEKNASNPPYVWGVNGSDNYLRTYATSSLRVAYSADSDKLDGYHITNYQTGGWYELTSNADTSSEPYKYKWYKIANVGSTTSASDSAELEFRIATDFNYPSYASYILSLRHYSTNSGSVAITPNVSILRQTSFPSMNVVMDQSGNVWVQFLVLWSSYIQWRRKRNPSTAAIVIYESGQDTTYTLPTGSALQRVGGIRMNISAKTYEYFSTYLDANVRKSYETEKVIVNQHTTNNVNYPIVWSNANNTSTTTANLLFKSYDHLYYNPSTHAVTAGRYYANQSAGPHFQATGTAGNWVYIRLHNSSNYWDIATATNLNSGALLFRPAGGATGRLIITTAGDIGTKNTVPSYALHVAGDIYGTGWSRAGSGFYVEGKGVHFMSNGSHGQLYLASSNEWCLSGNNATGYINYRAAAHGTTFTSYVWNAGSSTTYASHSLGGITGHAMSSVMNIGNGNNNTLGYYYQTGLQIREYNYGGAQADTWGNAPRLTWHWSGRVAAQIGLGSNGYLYEAPNTGTTFYKLVYESGTWGINISGNAATATSATNAHWLNTNSTLTYGASGLNYFNISGTAGTTANANVTPEAGWYHILRMNHANNNGYFFDIASPLNNVNGIYYRQVRSGANYGWYKLLDSNNYTSYTVTKTGGGASGTWGINISGYADWASCLHTKGTNTITNTTDDTTAKWGAHYTSIHWYTATGLLINQPSQYGYILNVGHGSEVHQLWMTQSSGNMYHRGGNPSGWNGTWRAILDSVNWSNYCAAASHTHAYLPLSGGNLTGGLTISAPTTQTNNYNEGLRVNLGGSSNWASVVLGGASGSTAGTGDGVWGLFVNAKNFYIGQNGSSNATYGLSWSNGGALNLKTSALTNNGNVLLDSGNYTDYISNGSRSVGDEVTPVYLSSGTLIACNSMEDISYTSLTGVDKLDARYSTMLVNATANGTLAFGTNSTTKGSKIGKNFTIIIQATGGKRTITIPANITLNDSSRTVINLTGISTIALAQNARVEINMLFVGPIYLRWY